MPRLNYHIAIKARGKHARATIPPKLETFIILTWSVDRLRLQKIETNFSRLQFLLESGLDQEPLAPLYSKLETAVSIDQTD